MVVALHAAASVHHQVEQPPNDCFNFLFFFPTRGERVALVWQQNSQNFVMTQPQ